MTDGELSADRGNQISQVGAVGDVRQQRAVLLVDGLPVRAVHRRVVEVLALDAPGFAEDLRPLRARIDQRFERADVDGALADLRRPVGGDDAPAIAVGAIEQPLRVGRERVGADALEKRRRSALAELIAMDGQRQRRPLAAFPRRKASRRGPPPVRCSRRPAPRAPESADRCPQRRRGPLAGILRGFASAAGLPGGAAGIAGAASSPVSGRNGDGSLALSTAR